MRESPLNEQQRYVHGFYYPTTREAVLQIAERNGAPADVLQRLSTLNPRVAGPHEIVIALRRYQLSHQPPGWQPSWSQQGTPAQPGLNPNASQQPVSSQPPPAQQPPWQ